MGSDPEGSDAELLHGWGRTAPTAARVVRPSTLTQAVEVYERAAATSDRGVVARGLGRSYGDAAQNAGGTVLDLRGVDRILSIDVPGRSVRVEAGVSLDALMRTTVPLGLWPFVSPGTRQVTVGGAIASDVHGKNHHADGSFAAHVRSLRLHTPALGTVTVGCDADPALFWATAGGMGLTGLVLEATLEMLPIETSWMRVDAERTADLDALMARMLATDGSYRYSVAWIDCLARGPHLGRAVLELAEHATLEDLPGHRGTGTLRFAARPLGAMPAGLPSGLLNRWTVAAFNELWYRKSPVRSTGHLVPLARYFHPLDGVRDWNRVYGSGGLVQYQMVVPDGEERCVRQAVEVFSRARCSSFLAVLKRFGAANPAPLSFPASGWTLALDLPARHPGLVGLLDGLDDMVAGSGGRVYLSKDSRLRPELLETMYPDLPRWREVRERADPERRIRSDLARRLPLVEPLEEGRLA